MNTERLIKNIIAVVKEEQIKLGYYPGKTNLIYMLSSLNSLLNTRLELEEMLKALENNMVYITKELADVSFELRGRDSICFVLGEAATGYIHENTPASGFIYDFIECIRTHGRKIEDVFNVFRRYSDNIVIKKSEIPDYDYLVYFEDGQPDEFWYCLKNEGHHVIYHRFIPEDFNAIFGGI